MNANSLAAPESNLAGDDSLPASSAFRRATLTILLQASHRLGAVALFSTIATWGMMYAIKDFHLALATTAGAADVGFCCGLAARMMTRPGQVLRREANGVTLFNLVLFVLAVHLMLFARLEVIRAAASDFFTPSPHNAVHG